MRNLIRFYKYHEDIGDIHPKGEYVVSQQCFPVSLDLVDDLHFQFEKFARYNENLSSKYSRVLNIKWGCCRALLRKML